MNATTPINPAREPNPHPVLNPDRIPAQRYYDQEFYELENKYLWPKVWQMACRLEEIPEVGDYVVYRILDKSVIVIRTAEDTIKAYHNHCRHRGVELVTTNGKTRGGFVCPFHGWRWDVEGNNTFVFSEKAYSPDALCKDDIALRTVRSDTWGGCVFINFDADAAPLYESLGAFAPHMDMFKVEDLKVEWWLSARVPCNWKLSMEAFMEGYHVATTHPQLLPPGSTNRPGESDWVKMPQEFIRGGLWRTVGTNMPSEVEPEEFIESYIDGMQLLSTGMAGMIHQEEVDLAKTLRGMDLPRDPTQAAMVFRRTFNDVLMKYYADKGMEIADLNKIDDSGLALSVNFCFPHFFLLPVHGAAASYRIRPLGPEECLFELWSLKRYPADEKRPRPMPPEPKAHDDPQWPDIPKQDYSNLPRQQRGLHSGFEFMRLAHECEGMISNYHRLIDGYIAGVDPEKLTAAAWHTSTAIDQPVRDIGF